MYQRFVASYETMAERLAESMRQDGGVQAVRLIRQLGLTERRDRPAPPPPATPGWVGIWQADGEGSEASYVRSQAHLHDWGRWAAVARIEPKSHSKRVIYLGESVARGWFFDPEWTPAGVLGKLLDDAAIPGGAEVVDLAKTDLDLVGLEQLASSSMALDPDALVIFAGNNWVRAGREFLVSDPAACRNASGLLRVDGVRGLHAWLEDTTARLVREALDRLVALAAAHQIPLVLLVPEFNLGDWHPTGDALPSLAGDAGSRWADRLVAAQAALDTGDHAAASRAAEQMIEIDGGTAAAGFRILARCALADGDPGGARGWLEQARDAQIWDGTSVTPRPLTAVQAAIRALGDYPHVEVVDLPRIFSRAFGPALPGRRLFTDYCHLTARGIQLAMMATAASLAPVLGGGRSTHTESDLQPLPDVEAQAHFGAAIHNAHWGQKPEVVRHHARKAVELSEDVAQSMNHFLDMQSRRVPAWMCSSAERLIELRSTALQRFMLSAPVKLFDRTLIDATVSALEPIDPSVRRRVEELRAGEHGVRAGRPLDLLDATFMESWDDRERRWASGDRDADAFFFRAHSLISRFPWVCSRAGKHRLTLTCRRSVVVGEGAACRVTLDDLEVAAVTPTESWQRFDLTATVDEAGEHEWALHWTPMVAPGEPAIEHAADRLAEGVFPDCLLACFGEIHSLTVAEDTENAS